MAGWQDLPGTAGALQSGVVPAANAWQARPVRHPLLLSHYRYPTPLDSLLLIPYRYPTPLDSLLGQADWRSEARYAREEPEHAAHDEQRRYPPARFVVVPLEAQRVKPGQLRLLEA